MSLNEDMMRGRPTLPRMLGWLVSGLMLKLKSPLSSGRNQPTPPAFTPVWKLLRRPSFSIRKVTRAGGMGTEPGQPGRNSADPRSFP